MHQKRSPWLPLAVLLLLFAAGTTFHFARQIGESRQADALWEACRIELADAGEPITFADIEARRPVIPDHENGAIVMENMRSELEALTAGNPQRVPFFDEDLRRTDPFIGIPQNSIDPMRTFLQQHESLAAALSKLRDATTGRLTKNAYDDVGDNPLEKVFPSLTPWGNAARLLQLLAYQALIDENVNAAVDSIATQFGIGATLRNEPTYITRSVRLRIIRGALSCIEATLKTGELNAQQLQVLEDRIVEQLNTISPVESMRAERVALMTLFDNLATEKITWADVFDETPLSHLGPASYVDFRQAQVRVAEIWTAQIESADDTVEALAEAANQRIAGIPFPTRSKSTALVSSLMPSWTFFAEQTARSTAELRSAHTALAAERFRMDHDQLPSALAELIPDYLESIPIDPFNGEPLLLGTTDDGIVIYSVGDNLTDDGGNLITRKGKHHAPDTGFRLAKKAKRGTVVAGAVPSDSSP